MHDPAFLDPTCISLFIRTENKLKLQKEEKKKKKTSSHENEESKNNLFH